MHFASPSVPSCAFTRTSCLQSCSLPCLGSPLPEWATWTPRDTSVTAFGDWLTMSEEEVSTAPEVEAEDAPKKTLLVVKYHPITGIPEEFNDYLPKDTEEYKRLKAHQEASTAGDGKAKGDAKEGVEKDLVPGVDNLNVDEAPKESKSKSKKAKPREVLVKVEQRKGKKMTTIVTGLDLFGLKPADCAKVFKKKFACGSGVSKNAEGKDEIEIQGSFMEDVGALAVKEWAANDVREENIFFVVNKKKVAMRDYAGEDSD